MAPQSSKKIYVSIALLKLIHDNMFMPERVNVGFMPCVRGASQPEPSLLRVFVFLRTNGFRPFNVEQSERLETWRANYKANLLSLMGRTTAGRDKF